MKRPAVAFLILSSVFFGAIGIADVAVALNVGNAELPKKRPSKQKKKTFVDFSKQEAAVLVVPTPLDRILKKSEKDVLVVRSRKIIAAPAGDSAEPLSAFEAKPSQAATTTPVKPPPTTPSKSTAALPSPSSSPREVPMNVQTNVPAAMPRLETESPRSLAPLPKSIAPESIAPEKIATESSNPTAFTSAKPLAPATRAKPDSALPTPRPMATISQTEVLPPPPLFVGPPSPTPAEKFESDTIETTTTRTHESEETETFTVSHLATVAPTPPTPAATPGTTMGATSVLAFLRTGILNANYKKFDDRMNNSATSLGLGVGRGFDTDWGSFEARAALDAYHAMDQSVTVDNIRMLSARTEIAYWLSHARVKPGISLGFGWVDYSIRSYRAVSGDDERNVTIRTHAKGRAFSIIPGTSLRIEIGHGLVIDTQTEFVALLGGEASDAAQGFGATVGLGWIF